MTPEQFEHYYRSCVESAETFIRARHYDTVAGMLSALHGLACHLYHYGQLNWEVVDELFYMACGQEKRREANADWQTRNPGKKTPKGKKGEPVKERGQRGHN